jgi:hypothetical protein
MSLIIYTISQQATAPLLDACSSHMGLALNPPVLGLLFPAWRVCTPARHINDVLRQLGVSIRGLAVLLRVQAENSLLDEG